MATVRGLSRNRYPSDLADARWRRLVHPVPRPEPGGRPAKQARREIVDAVLYQAREGCTRRAPPHDLPPYRVVSHDLRAWQADGTRGAIHAAPRGEVRPHAGRNRRPTTGIADRRTVRATGPGGPWGYDGGEKARGRERQVAVDTRGLIRALVVTPAAVRGWDGGREVPLRAKLAAPRLARAYAAPAYAAVPSWACWFARVIVLPAREEPGQGGFVVPPRRWVVERTLGWLNRYRRLGQDYERTTASGTAFVYVSMIHVMARRLTT